MDTPSDHKAVQRVLDTARLARLELSPERARELAPQFERILEAFGRLAALDPSVSPAGVADGAPHDVTRADQVCPGFSREEFLAAAPARTVEHLQVPRAVGREP